MNRNLLSRLTVLAVILVSLPAAAQSAAPTNTAPATTPESFTPDRIRDILCAADVNELNSLRSAGVSPRAIEFQFKAPNADKSQYVAYAFFTAAKSSPGVLDWFKAELKDGFDPNLLIPNSYYEEQSVLAYALYAGNLPATMALLDAGAYPNPYQNIADSTPRFPLFLFPYAWLTKTPFSPLEKAQLAAAFQKAGAVVFEENPTAKQDLTRLPKWGQALGVTLSDVPSLDQDRHPVAATRSSRPGQTDWAQFCATVPTTSNINMGDLGLKQFIIRNFLGAYHGEGFFLGTCIDDRFLHYILIRISADQSKWTLYTWDKADFGYSRGKVKPQDLAAHPGMLQSEFYTWRYRTFDYRPAEKALYRDKNLEYTLK
jgi:hypothetical protein